MADNLAVSLTRHKGSLGENKVFKSYVLANNSWLIGQILFAETTLFYEIRAIDGEVYGLELGNGPQVFESTFLSAGFNEVNSKSDLVEGVLKGSDTLKDFYSNLYRNSNMEKEIQWPERSENIKLTGLEIISSFEIGHRYTKHVYLLKGASNIYVTCDISIYKSKDDKEIVNAYRCDDPLQR